MITVLTIESNVYFNLAFKYIARSSFGCAVNMVQTSVLTEENISQADVVILPMAQGEMFICHKILVHRKPNILIICMYKEPVAVSRSKMARCLKEAIFIQRSDTVDRIREQLQHAWCRQRGACMSCNGCRIQTLTDIQQQVVGSFIRGESTDRIANRFNITGKTVSTHKYKVMEKFGLRNQVELFHLLRCMNF